MLSWAGAAKLLGKLEMHSFSQFADGKLVGTFYGDEAYASRAGRSWISIATSHLEISANTIINSTFETGHLGNLCRGIAEG